MLHASKYPSVICALSHVLEPRETEKENILANGDKLPNSVCGNQIVRPARQRESGIEEKSEPQSEREREKAPSKASLAYNKFHCSTMHICTELSQ